MKSIDTTLSYLAQVNHTWARDIEYAIYQKDLYLAYAILRRLQLEPLGNGPDACVDMARKELATVIIPESPRKSDLRFIEWALAWPPKG